jgi:hypothetical protein
METQPNFDIMNSPNFGALGGANEAANIQLRQEQIRNQQLQNELLRQQLGRQQSQSWRPGSDTTIFRNWKNANPWFGVHVAKTEVVKRYANQLYGEKPYIDESVFYSTIDAWIREQEAAHR